MNKPPQDIRRVFIVLDDFKDQKANLRSYLAKLVETAEEGQFLRTAGAYYRRKTDVALIELKFGSADFSAKKRRWLSKLAGENGIPLLDPMRLSPEDRKTFYDRYLTKYPHQIDQNPSLLKVLDSLEQFVSEFDNEIDSKPTTAKMSRLARSSKIVTENPKISVNFQIGEEWQSAHLRSLTTKEAVLAVGALPPNSKRVRLEFNLKKIRVLASGTIENFPNSKIPSFKVKFNGLNKQEEQGIMDLLLAATEDKIQLKAPPSRNFPRFQLRWPVKFMIGETVHAGLIQDISTQGMFIATQEPLSERSFQLHFSHDQISTLITGVADVVREIKNHQAEASKTLLGYGLTVRNYKLEHNFQKFVNRVERRSQRHIVIAADRKRGATLSQELQACGYRVSICENTDSVLTMQDESNLPDLGLADSSFSSSNPKTDVRKLLSNLSVSCLLAKDSPIENRQQVDRSLGIR